MHVLASLIQVLQPQAQFEEHEPEHADPTQLLYFPSGQDVHLLDPLSEQVTQALLHSSHLPSPFK